MKTSRNCSSCGQPLPESAPEGLCPACLMSGALQPTEPVSGAAPDIAAVCSAFPQLEIHSLVGRGGMGMVFKARQPQLDRWVALKVLAPERNGEPRFAERFQREAQALARLDHPNIVTVHDFGRAGGGYFLLMEFVNGVHLRQLLQQGRMAPHEALAVVPQICDALQFAHDQGIVHRDIKPENILIDRRGRVKVADFGLAKLVGAEAGGVPVSSVAEEAKGDRSTSDLTEAGKVMGTPRYMAPEQIESPAAVDHRADIYALGVVFYQMLTGELPGKKIEPPSKKVRIDVRLDEIVLRALAKEPELRYQQVTALKTQVETLTAQAPAAGASVESPAAPAATSRSPWLPILEALFRTRFTSPLAVKFANASALGWLAALASLGYVPLPGWHRCFGFAGFSGFFGLIGVACLVEVIHRRRAKQARDAAPAAAGQPQVGVAPRLSRTAITGAAWALSSMAPLAYWSSSSGRSGDFHWASPWHLGGFALLMLPGLLAPVGATVLGWMAVSQIRRGAGRLRGLGLALFAGLLFPLLLLDGLVAWCWFGVANLAMNFIPSTVNDSLLQTLLIAFRVLAVLSMGLVDWLVIRRTWRQARQAPDAGADSDKSALRG